MIGKKALFKYTYHEKISDKPFDLKEVKVELTGEILDKFNNGEEDLYLVEIHEYFVSKEWDDNDRQIIVLTPECIVKFIF